MDNERIKKLKAFEFLCERRYGTASTVSIENKPESALLYYIVKDKDIYFITPRISRKYRNLLTNDRISLTVFSEKPPLELQIEGSAETIDNPDLKDEIAKLYLEQANKNPQTVNWPPVLKLPNLEGFGFIRINAEWFKFSDFSSQDASVIEGSAQDWE